MIKRGFTLVEVMLFLGLSGALIALVVGGTQRNIAEKRYNDTVDNFISYLEGLYSGVSYVSHGGSGNSDQAVYGKLVDIKTDGGKTISTAYTILGNVKPAGEVTEDTLNAVLKLSPTITNGAAGNFVYAETYTPSWGGKITSDHIDSSNNHIEWLDPPSKTQSQILLLILRHPRTGMTSTYVYYPNSISGIGTGTKITGDDSSLAGKGDNTSNDNFKEQDANLCIDSDDRWAAGNQRRLIRIHKGANNASGVEAIIANDEKNDFCKDT